MNRGSGALDISELLPDGTFDDLAVLAATLCRAPAATVRLRTALGARRHSGAPEGARVWTTTRIVSDEGEELGTLDVSGPNDADGQELGAGARDALATLARQIGARLSSARREQALRAMTASLDDGEARLRAVFTSAPACICVLRGPEHVFELANPPYRELLGGRAIEGLPARVAVPELEPHGYFELLDRVYRTGEPFWGKELPTVIRRPDGTTFEVFFDFVYQPIRGASDEPEGIIAFGFDVTSQVLARRRAEELARERERLVAEVENERVKLQRLLQGAPFAVVVYEGRDHVARFSNAKHDEITGGRVVIGRPVLESLPELASTEVMRHMNDVFATGETKTVRESRSVLARDGQLQDCWFDVTWQAMHDVDGAVSGVLVAAIDVTDHVVARRNLEAAHRITDAIASNATLGLLMMNANQRCTFMNPAAEAITGFRLEELGDEPLHALIHHTRPDGTPYPIEECPIDRALPTKIQERGEDVFVHKDGHFYPVAFTASPLLEDGKAVGTVIEVRDTTQEKAAQRERERMLAELRAAVAARDEFLSIASHELKTPLTPLQLQLDSLEIVLERAGGKDDAWRSKLGRARRQTERLSKLVEDLLDVSRVANGRLHLHVEPFDLAPVVHEVVERFRGEAQRAGCEIDFASSGGVVGSWDRLRIEQVTANLISNAVKYGAGKPVSVRVGADGDDATIAVCDRGIGIADVDRSRIFERFERAVSMRHYGGLGLGLYIVRQIVDAHGGVIRVASRPGEGSTFTVSLPRDVASAATALGRRERAEAAS